ncbi:hypothetical protein ESA_01096 [Cronobacter sakazakii ATCC BAA-894]|uniref:Uncharacterized protein n=1 Tax=Cronobacter sakazakii (strain ATCC BAA-894) TaxID=290339 RepID=A7MHM8_CROS8|nr:hypothetical protein ESA_01096 [Cronobacter sakazakii ATCC BAA-894]
MVQIVAKQFVSDAQYDPVKPLFIALFLCRAQHNGVTVRIKSVKGAYGPPGVLNP